MLKLQKIVFLLLIFVLNLNATQILINGVIEVTDPKIYYTLKDGFYIMSGPDYETKGIRTNYHGGTILYSWKEISKIDFTHTKEKTTASIILKDSSKKEVELISPSKDGLYGKVEGREFSIGFEKIKTISFRE